MPTRRSIVINGDLGSGKSTVSKLLAERLSIKRISVGDLYREMAAQRGMTALQLNLHAELDDKIDTYVDELQSGIAASGEQLIVDSRLAWFFFKDALKIHMITEPMVAARRVLSRPGDEVESYASVEEAIERLASRSESERLRFVTRYGADKTRLRNYDLICDSTGATPDQIVEAIVEVFHRPQTADPVLFLDPTRIYPTAEITAVGGMWGSDLVESVKADPGSLETISVGYAHPNFFVIDGHRRLSAAIQNGLRLVPARLAAEANEEVAAGVTALQYIESEVTPARIDDWAEAHEISLPAPHRTRVVPL
jgi:predicted cytidylate kinase